MSQLGFLPPIPISHPSAEPIPTDHHHHIKEVVYTDPLVNNEFNLLYNSLLETLSYSFRHQNSSLDDFFQPTCDLIFSFIKEKSKKQLIISETVENMDIFNEGSCASSPLQDKCSSPNADDFQPFNLKIAEGSNMRQVLEHAFLLCPGLEDVINQLSIQLVRGGKFHSHTVESREVLQAGDELTIMERFS